MAFAARGVVRFVLFAAAMVAATAPTRALVCDVRTPNNPNDVRLAEIVVIGRIADYRVVLGQEMMRQERLLLARQGLSPAQIRTRERTMIVPYDRAMFTVAVDRVLRGSAGQTLIVTWDNSGGPLPATLAAGPYLFALRDTVSRLRSRVGQAASSTPAPDPHVWAVMQAPCAAPLMFEAASPQAATAQRAL